ncbi:MAG TPA: hypothetical protein VKP69_13620 [Isosphaeraceae bacterium]|nr:hypothetical protein [Isosphaeraceae bacterium]
MVRATHPPEVINMRPRVSPRVVLGLLLVVSPRAASAEGLKADIAAGTRLLAEGDAQADKGETTEAVILYKRAFETLLPGLRKLPFKHEVRRDVTAREDLRALLIKEIDEEMSPAEFHANELGMKALGLLPRDINLKETMVKVYAEEIAAFYDTKTKTMHLIREPEAKQSRSFLERLLGKEVGFDKDENKTVIAHELTHALADQNFDIDAMQEAIKHEHDDDRDLALSALIEGEATLTMIGAQMNDWDGTKIKDLPSAGLDRVFSLMMPLLPLAGGASLREAPVILSETMIFPYLRGLIFCARLTNGGGWDALSDAYRAPPLSTEQILHPEKYRAQLDRPTRVDLGTLEAGCGWHEVGRNVVGEMQLGVMLRRHGGRNAAAGWDGDRYAVFEGPNGRLGLVWLTTWDSEADAREFALGYARFQAAKLGAAPPPPEKHAEASRQGAVFALERRGADVAVVEGFPPDTTNRLLEAAFRATKAEMTYTPPERGRKTQDR